MKYARFFLLLGAVFTATSMSAVDTLKISNPETWTRSQLSAYVGKTVVLGDRWYVCNNYSGYAIGPRRSYAPTNQARPLSTEYYEWQTLNSNGTISLSGVNDYHRMGECLENATVEITSTSSMRLVKPQWSGNSRADILKGYDHKQIDYRGRHTLLVCAANLEYYLVETSGGQMGPASASEHAKQREKVSQALALINADIYGFVEVEKGQSAVGELAADLTRKTGRHFTYIDDHGTASGTMTKSCYVYCSDVVKPYSTFRENQQGVKNRKIMQCFEQIGTGERFIFSINHFKAKSGTGTGDNANKGDGQSSFNGDRIREAQSVLNEYDLYSTFVNEEDILIMGDLNAYAMEDPIMELRNGGMIDLHRYFHADSSYSYTYRNEAGYLDHALCNGTMLSQVTGMMAFHINSDEKDCYTYDGSCNDGSMFRYSDHDPVLVGLQLGQHTTISTGIFVTPEIMFNNGYAEVCNAVGGTIRIYNMQGEKVTEESITSHEHSIHTGMLNSGIYLIHLYYNGEVTTHKIIVR